MTLPPGGARSAARLLAEVAASPALGEELARAYDGRHDVLDALWWRAHSGTPAPSGAPNPAAHLATLAERAYGRDATPADTVALQDAEAMVAADDTALDAAIAAVALETDGLPGPESSDHRRPAESDSEVRDADAEEAPARGRRLIPATIAVAVIVGLTITCGYLAFRVGESEERFNPPVPAGGLDPFARFTVEQTAADQPNAPLPRDYDAATVRRLVRDEPGLLTDYSLFGARTEDQDICLLMVFPDGEIASTCVSVSEFRRNGIEVSTNVLRPSAVSEGAMVPVAHTVTWQPDDSLLFASSGAESP